MTSPLSIRAGGIARNTATVTQTGLTDRAYLYQYGQDAIATVNQYGSSDTATVTQTASR